MKTKLTTCFKIAGILQDLRAVTAPAEVQWNTNHANSGWQWLIFVYDWDILRLSNNVSNIPSSTLNLCTEYFPCALNLRGGPRSTLQIPGDGRFVCLASVGCSQIALFSVDIVCTGNRRSIFTMQGSALFLSNVSVAGCRSNSDGAALHAYDMAQIVIDASNFTDLHSTRLGGAVSTIGSNISLSGTRFENCFAEGGGGAVRSESYPDCFGTNESSRSYLRIQSSTFTHCGAEGPGGALLAHSSTSAENRGTLDVSILSSNFLQCTSASAGGALRVSGSQVSAYLTDTLLDSCISDGSGGSISLSDFSSLSVVNCKIQNNTALGRGPAGGAVHLNRSYF